MTYLSEIKLHFFRNYSSFVLDELKPGFIALTGPNGAGKTNILEAVSLLSPGRGLRRAGIEDLQKMVPATAKAGDGTDTNCSESSRNAVVPGKNQTPPAWAISARICDGWKEHRLGAGMEPGKKKKRFRLNGMTLPSQAAVDAYLSLFWLTPQMDGLFLGSASGRRRFLDRMIYSLDPAHSGRLLRYEKAFAQRSKLLREGQQKTDPLWLAALETQMAGTGVALAATRVEFVHKLASSLGNPAGPHFPKADLKLSGYLEDRLESVPALELEENFSRELAVSRAADSVTGGAAIGPHKTDFTLLYSRKTGGIRMEAGNCSTGEQKILLIALVLAHARLVTAEKGMPPLLLLDEATAHLDPGRRDALFAVLSELGGQIWLTATDRSAFGSLRADFISLEDGRIKSRDSAAPGTKRKYAP